MVIGRIEFSKGANLYEPEIRKRYEFGVSANIVSSECAGIGGELVESKIYEPLMFLMNAEKYELVVPVSQQIKSGESDRFSIPVSAPQSSTHNFKIELIYNGSRKISTPKVKLELMVPRSVANLAKDRDQ